MKLNPTLNYSGDYTDEPIVIDVYHYDQDSCIHQVYDTIEAIEINHDHTWINITGLHDISVLRGIEKRFKINRLSLEDIVQVSTHSKIEKYTHYTFSIFKMLYLRKKIVHEHIAIIKLDHVIISFQETKGDIFDALRAKLETDFMLKTNDMDYLYYKMVDALVDQYFEILPVVNGILDDLEDDVLDEKESSLEALYKVRKELLLIKNSVFPIKLILQTYLSRYPSDYKLFYNDLLDHLDQIIDNVTLNRELVNTLYDTHMSNMSHKMNRIMTTLALFSTIFIPLSFLAGFFGMNFKHFPSLNGYYSLYIFIGSCLLLTGGMVLFFKRKKLL